MWVIRKLRKNKFIVLAICVIVVSLFYIGVQRAIDNHQFNKNEDIVNEEENFDESNEEKSSKGDMNNGSSKTQGQFEEGEIDVEVNNDSDGEGINDAVDNAESVGDSGENDTSNQTNMSGSNSNKIYIYITGEVNVPGVVILNEGSRIVDAINSAGGTTAKANVTKVNLVYVLEDGMKVNIPNDNDLKNNPDFEYITLNSGDGGREDYSGSAHSTGSSSSNSFASNGSNSNASANSGGIDSGSEKKYSVVNINTATQTELETLPGIGPSLALKIINYRKEHGKFSSIEEIKDVSGIGESKFESLKRYITV